MLRVFVPFTAAFFLSYLFRSINALIVSDLGGELGLTAADIGLLTSVYFLSFAALQVPVGIWLDRHGPRRVETALLVFAAAGALLFAASTGLVLLTLSRALIGVGVAAAFAAGIKANAQWFPSDRAATMNGWLFMLGALGAFGATSPARLVLEASGGWRGLFVILAIATLVCALAIWITVPDTQPGVRPGTSGAVPAGGPASDAVPGTMAAILGDRRFVAVAPLSAACAGTAWALQGLWAAPWLSDVDGLPAAEVTRRLVVMAIAVCVAAIVFGTAADRLRRRGIGTAGLLAGVAAAVIAAQLALVLGCPASVTCWPVIAAAGSVPVLSFAYLAEFVPRETSGRANGVLNLFHFAGAFAVQFLIGVILSRWPAEHGHYPPAAWQTAFGLNLLLQAAALGYFVHARSRVAVAALRRVAALVSSAVVPATIRPARRRPVMPGERLDAARRRVMVWRLAGLGAVSLAAGLSLTFAISAVSAGVLPAASAVPHRDRLAAAPAAVEPVPPDVEIAYALAGFVAAVRSLSTDPAVVRANRNDALSRVTRRGAEVLARHFPGGGPLEWPRRRSVTVRVISVERTTADSFAVHWEETVLEDGATPRRDHLTGVIAIAFDTVKTFRNPLGLYVDRFAWWRDPVINGG